MRKGTCKLKQYSLRDERAPYAKDSRQGSYSEYSNSKDCSNKGGDLESYLKLKIIARLRSRARGRSENNDTDLLTDDLVWLAEVVSDRLLCTNSSSEEREFVKFTLLLDPERLVRVLRSLM